MCNRLRRGELGERSSRRIALHPKPPDCSDEVALQGTHCFATGLAFADAARDVGFRLLRVTGLRERDHVEDRVEAAIAATVQPVPQMTGRRRLERGGPGVCGKRRIMGEAPTWPQYPRQASPR